jgi:hypothetical protein
MLTCDDPCHFNCLSFWILIILYRVARNQCQKSVLYCLKKFFCNCNVDYRVWIIYDVLTRESPTLNKVHLNYDTFVKVAYTCFYLFLSVLQYYVTVIKHLDDTSPSKKVTFCIETIYLVFLNVCNLILNRNN